jgi:hypothetical protein
MLLLPARFSVPLVVLVAAAGRAAIAPLKKGGTGRCECRRSSFDASLGGPAVSVDGENSAALVNKRY